MSAGVVGFDVGVEELDFTELGVAGADDFAGVDVGLVEGVDVGLVEGVAGLEAAGVVVVFAWDVEELAAVVFVVAAVDLVDVVVVDLAVVDGVAAFSL